MRIPEYHCHDRNRKCSISYLDPDFRRLYDLDKADFQSLVQKLQLEIPLDYRENMRYGDYLLTMCLIVLEHLQFRKKTKGTKEKILDDMYMKLIEKITNFDPNKGSVYSYAYRLAFTAGCNYFNDLIREQKNQKKLDQHIRSCVDEYLSDVSDHKVGDRSATVHDIWY